MMTSATSESVWSNMIAARQLSTTYYTLSTCLTDYLHRYFSQTSTSNLDASSSLFHNLDETLHSSTTQSQLLDEYSNVIQNILKKNSLHTNIIQNVRRLFRFDSCLKQLFTLELNEHCQCQECDCTISNSITDVIHEVGEIRANLLTETCQIPCVCFRCGDQNQSKNVTFKQCNASLALAVNRLDAKPTDQLTNSQGLVYELVYIIEFDPNLRTILNVYLRQDSEFIKVDGPDASTRSSTLTSHGKFLTLWLSRSNIPPTQPQPYLSPPQSASSSSQITTNSNDISTNSFQTESTITFDELFEIPTQTLNDPLSVLKTTNDDDEEDDWWNRLSNNDSTPAVSEDLSAKNSDSVSDILLTLLHSTTKDSPAIKNRTDHDRLVNTLSSDVIWPLIVDKTNRRTSKKSSSSTTSTVHSISSNSSRSFKQLATRVKPPLRSHPYTKA